MVNRPVDRRREQAAPPSGGAKDDLKAEDAPDSNRWLILVGPVLSVIMKALDTTIINVAGRKRCLVISVLLFIVASFFCGTSRSLGQLVFWRVLQRVGGAALLSTAQATLLATLLEIFPQSR